jgi:glycine/D-amino acid oxidase-like deaminating enzyme
MGCSNAYHLAKLGYGDVVLLEKSGLTAWKLLPRRRAGWAASEFREHHPSSRQIRRPLRATGGGERNGHGPGVPGIVGVTLR